MPTMANRHAHVDCRCRCRPIYIDFNINRHVMIYDLIMRWLTAREGYYWVDFMVILETWTTAILPATNVLKTTQMSNHMQHVM